MLLPDKHITLAESVLGLGAVVLDELKRPRSIDQLYDKTRQLSGTTRLPAYHDIESLILAILFLYAVDAIELTASGDLRRCAS